MNIVSALFEGTERPSLTQSQLGFLGIGHPTIHSPEQALEILDKFHRMFVRPTADEGFERILSLDSNSQSLNYTSPQLKAILSRVASSPALAPQRSIREYLRPQPPRGGRGFGPGRGRRPFRGSFSSSFVPRDSDTSSSWRSGRGRDSASQSPSEMRIAGRGWSDKSFASSSFGNRRAFGGRSPARGAGVTAQLGADRFETGPSQAIAPRNTQPESNNAADVKLDRAGELPEGS